MSIMVNFCENKTNRLAVQGLEAYYFRSSGMAHKCPNLPFIFSMAEKGSKSKKRDCSRSQRHLKAFCTPPPPPPRIFSKYKNLFFLSESEYPEFKLFSEFQKFISTEFVPSGANLSYSVFPGIWQENKPGKWRK